MCTTPSRNICSDVSINKIRHVVFPPPPPPPPYRFTILNALGVRWTEPIFCDWENPEGPVDYQWQEWGHHKIDPDDPDVAVGTEFGIPNVQPDAVLIE